MCQRERKLVKNSLATEGEEWIRKLPALRRYRIYCTPADISGKSEGVAFIRLKCPTCAGSGRKNSMPPIDRGLTARPVVLAKTYEPGASYCVMTIRAGRYWPTPRHLIRPKFRAISAITIPNNPRRLQTIQAMPAVLLRTRRREAEAVSIRLRPAAFAR